MDINLFRNVFDQHHFTDINRKLKILPEIRVRQFGQNKAFKLVLALEPLLGLLLWIDHSCIQLSQVHDQAIVCAHNILVESVLVPVSDLEVVTKKLLKLKVLGGWQSIGS